ncbi:restriction endonuclease subunit S [Escherichia sp. 93.1518]|uniref:restriction endonuclease subunit S n=1 Tax=Escherichia sp. 93.1518 TaxID=2723311 RepID=UPI0016045433|nr:restriction endonuclease subunit S [Escherichia sp. 93.1518]EJV7174677.1 restriction endonuclease subunit S [Escherichia coli]MBB2320201.1 restriction endonuclease subunit S [Escherichia sp. 93.1518]
MGNKWPEFRLDEITTLIVDCPHSTPEWTDSGVIVLRSNNIRNGALDLATPSFTTEEGYLERIKRAIPSEEDIVLTREAPMGEVCIIPKGIKCCLGQRMVLIRADKSQVIPEYLLYVMQSSYIQHQISWNEGTGTTVSNIRIPNIKALKIPLPKITIQRTIVSNLLVIDKKIAINTGINQTLEQMSQTLFKSWFVDFDPVIDNALDAGNPIPEALQARAELRQKVRNSTDFKPLPTEIRSLFPSEFEETELGWVPKGWHYKNAEEIATISIGKTPPRTQKECFCDKKDSNYAWVSIKDLGNCSVFIKDSSEYLTSDAVNSYNVKIVPKDAVLLSFKLTIGRIAIAEDILTTNEAIAHFYNMKHGINKEYLYSYLKIFDYNSLGSTSSIATAINSKIIRKIPVLVPDGDILEKYKKSTDIIFQKIKFNNGNICNLTALRDTLLPKLISGELSLDDLPDLTTDTEAP